MSVRSISEVRELAAPWLGSIPGSWNTVDTGDSGDDVVFDELMDASAALRRLDEVLTQVYGADRLVEDLWRLAYGKRPEVLAAEEVAPYQRVNREIVAAMAGTPEHEELRQSTVGDVYMSAVAVLAQGRALRQMLAAAEEQRQQADQAQQTQDEAQRAAEKVQQALDAAEDAADGSDTDDQDDENDQGAGGDENGSQPGESQGQNGAGDDPEQDEREGREQGEGDGQDGEGEGMVPGPVVQVVEDACAAAEAAAQDAADAQQQLEQAMQQAAATLRAAARAAADQAGGEVADQAAAFTMWGSGAGEEAAELERMDPDARMELADQLRNGKLAQFAELIGRFRTMAKAQRAKRVEHARGEYVGVTLGGLDDIGDLVPSELANLAHPALRAAFIARLVQGQALVFEQRGEERQGQGAIICVVDCSKSMRHRLDAGLIDAPTAEAYAKALGLALLDQARAARPPRDCVLIPFHVTALEPLVFSGKEPVSLASKVAFAETGLGGGTKFMDPLTSAMRLLDAEYNRTGRSRGDIVFITDGKAPVTEQWLQVWREAKHRLGVRCVGVRVGAAVSGYDPVEEISDDVKLISDFTDPAAAADLFRAI
jgi:uncharacterized protein with von Willebrand factor type A (vWA) domain